MFFFLFFFPEHKSILSFSSVFGFYIVGVEDGNGKVLLALYRGNIISDVASAQGHGKREQGIAHFSHVNGCGKCITSGSRLHLLGSFSLHLYMF